ncbi:MAG: PD-(D/E)XK nuclease domain-containing protein [Dysgonamonadaceae bacterium]|nr:PD-(D/E)XK nuclease domain-containing protein [Dysgonamonadaceae bacterium]
MSKRKVRFFNKTGPCNPDDHYMLPPEDRLIGAQLHRYIRDQLYWVLHAPRQTGKTTFLLSWMRELNVDNNDVAHLFAQRTAETGQQITREALDYVWEQSQGQPWIVNNLFMRATRRVLDEDSTETVALEHVTAARQQMVLARETHLETLAYRLSNPQVRHIIETILTGELDPQMSPMNPDVQLSMDLRLVRWDNTKGFVISNPVYEEILTRYFNAGYHANLPPPSAWKWQRADGSLDMDSLLQEFQKFWRRNSAIWEEKADYTEAFPHLLLMAFMQRITNGEGNISRESAAGRGRMDLEIEYHGQHFIIEIKIVHDYETRQAVQEEGLEQIRAYRDAVNPSAPAYLVIFDRRTKTKEKSWDDRIGWEEIDDVTVVRA